MNVIAKAGQWRIREGNDIAYAMSEKFNPKMYDLTENYMKQIKSYINNREDFRIEVLEDGYYVAL